MLNIKHWLFGKGEIQEKPDEASVVDAKCPICMTVYPLGEKTAKREGHQCPDCNASGRSSAIVHYVNKIGYDNDKCLKEQTPNKEVTIIGLSDGPVYAKLLKEKFDYTNTFYHQEPFLDISNPPEKMLGTADILISTEVFEHVIGDVKKAFDGAMALLKPGGSLILTVPYQVNGQYREHYPDAVDYKSYQNEEKAWVADITNSDGSVFTDKDAKFHGGPGKTLEMRLFNQAELQKRLDEAGFTQVVFHDENLPRHGILWNKPSRVITAVKPKSQKYAADNSTTTPAKDERYEKDVSERRAKSLARARSNKEMRTRNEIANFSKTYRMPMYTTKAKRNAFAHAQKIIQEKSIKDPVNFAKRAMELSREKSLKVLTVCCGGAATEKSLFANVKNRAEITLVDINQDLLDMASEKLSDVADTKTICGDANTIELPVGQYDVAICVAGLHHIVELEHLMAQLAACLKSDGEFWSIGEYVGRNGARLWPESYEVANDIFSKLPEKYRINNVIPKTPKPVNDNLLNVDCSETTYEGIRADEVEEILLEHFEPVQVNHWSTIAWRVVGPAYVDNYDLDNEEDRETIERIANIDADMFLSGKLRPVGLKGIYRPIKN